MLLSFIISSYRFASAFWRPWGIGVFAGPSAGFLFLYPVVAYFIGIIRDAYLHKINFLVIFIATLVIGVLD